MMNSLKIILLLTLIWLQISSGGGKSGFNFLSIGVDAKVVSLADAGVALPPELGTIYYNPAGLGTFKRSSVLITYRNWMVDGKFLYTSVLIPTKFLNFALSLTYISATDIEIRERPGEAEGKFTSRDFGISLSASPNLGTKLKVGMTAKYILEKIFVDETNLVSFDLGVLYSFKLSQFNFQAGASLKDFGSKGKFRTESINPPTTLSIGASISYSIAPGSIDILLNIEAKRKFYDSLNLLSVGIGFKFLSNFNLNFGYIFAHNPGNLRFGGGIELSKFSVHYAFSPLGYNFPDSHVFTINFNL
ncbi:hypothetical protein JGI5_00636 [Candidatus Kryptonium thompsonii]|nr:hypothetical protein JGI5_00636 [Candidatus Kryptonium thompsoni]